MRPQQPWSEDKADLCGYPWPLTVSACLLWLTWAHPKELPTLLSVPLLLLSPECTSSLLHILLFSQTRMSTLRRMEISPSSLALVGLALSTARGQCAWQKCTMTADSCPRPGEPAEGIGVEPAGYLSQPYYLCVSHSPVPKVWQAQD